MKRYWKYIRPYIQYYILGPCFMMMEVVGDVLLPYMLAKIINQGIAERNVVYIIKIGAIMGFIAVIMAVGGVLGAWFASKAAMNFGADLRMDLFEKIQQFSFQNIDNFSTGSLITRLTNDITQIQNMIMMTLRMCLRSPGILIGAMVMAFVISPKLAAIFIIVLPVLAVLIVVIMRCAFPQFRTLQEKLDALNSCIQEGLVGIRLIKSFVRGDYEEMRFEKRNQQLKEANLTAMKTMLLYTPLMTLALNITTVVVVWSGGNMIVAGNMQVGDLTAFTNYIVQIMSSLTMLSIAFLNWARAIASFRRVGEVLDEKIDLTDENAKHKDRAVCEGSVEFQNVSFRYYKNSPEWVIENISFKLEAGKTLGIIGPTGSGKSTTLYMILEYLTGRNINISTIEDPVEKNLPGINQTQVNPVAGLTFDVGLRALMRQDPDVIMVGETRDGETAGTSVRAAITGHVVLSTLHTNDAVSSIVRLEDMGVATYLVANSLVGLVAQRLLRKVCPNCAKEVETTEQERLFLGEDVKIVRKGMGCSHCKGRIAVHEILAIDNTVRRMIVNHNSVEEISAYAREHQHMRTLKESGLILVKEGMTTPEELIKISYE